MTQTQTPGAMAMKPAGNTAQTKRVAKAPAPRGRKKTHTKPAVPREAVEAVEVSRQMYASLLAEGAPKAGPMGYMMGALTVVKILIDQAEQQGEDRGEMRRRALEFIASI